MLVIDFIHSLWIPSIHCGFHSFIVDFIHYGFQFQRNCKQTFIFINNKQKENIFHLAHISRVNPVKLFCMNPGLGGGGGGVLLLHNDLVQELMLPAKM